MKTEIIGDDMQAVIAHFDPNEEVVAEAGGMMYMKGDVSINAEMRGGLLKGLMRSVFGGESLFLTIFKSGTQGGEVGFAAPYPGHVAEVKLSNSKILCERSAYMLSIGNIEMNVELTKRLGAGFFGGEGFILQSLQGTGSAFFHGGGNFILRELKQGETLKVDTGCLVAFDDSVQYDIQSIGGIKTSLFGGEGIFVAQMTGPGRVWLQTLPFSRMAEKVLSAVGTTKGQSRGAAGIGGNFFKGLMSGS